MGVALDTVLAFSTQGAAAPFPTALAPATGDSLAARNFAVADTAAIEAVLYSAGGGQKVRVTSPRLHDNVTGLTWEPAEDPAAFLLPEDASVQLQSGDQLAMFGGIAAAGTITAGLVNYYSNLPGVAARLHMWGDIKGIIKSFKTVEVDLGAIAVGAWTDTLFTATENQLHSNSDYAILGYEAATALTCIGVKGAFTGNLRACGPGPTSTLDITEYYVHMSERNGIPYIPVFNANDRFACYVSAFNRTAVGAGTAHVYLIVAELAQIITP